MRITAVRTYVVDGGFRPWTFVKVETSDPGLVGWGDCTDWAAPGPVTATVARFADFVMEVAIPGGRGHMVGFERRVATIELKILELDVDDALAR